MSKDVARFSTEAMEALILYSWPGNVRQLGNEIRRLIATNESGALITSDMLSPDMSIANPKHPLPSTESPRITLSLKQPMATAVTELERLMVEHALNEAKGQVTKAAQLLGLSRKGLYLKRHRLGISDNVDRSVSVGPRGRPLAEA
jgi:two-component system response regulator HupR/HoxA